MASHPPTGWHGLILKVITENNKEEVKTHECFLTFLLALSWLTSHGPNQVTWLSPVTDREGTTKLEFKRPGYREAINWGHQYSCSITDVLKMNDHL